MCSMNDSFQFVYGRFPKRHSSSATTGRWQISTVEAWPPMVQAYGSQYESRYDLLPIAPPCTYMLIAY